MYWFIAKIVYQILVPNGREGAQFEEQLRLIHAANHLEALGKAMAIGEQEESVFYNYKDQRVHWKFLNVPELRLVHQLDDGLQLYSRLEQPEYADAYMALVQDKAESIRTEKAYLF